VARGLGEKTGDSWRGETFRDRFRGDKPDVVGSVKAELFGEGAEFFGDICLGENKEFCGSCGM